CIPLAPGAGRLQAQLALGPDQGAAAAQPTWFEDADRRAVRIAGFEATAPEPAPCQTPALVARLRCRRAREQPVEADRPDASNRVEPAFAFRPLEHDLDHVAAACHKGAVASRDIAPGEQPARSGEQDDEVEGEREQRLTSAHEWSRERP